MTLEKLLEMYDTIERNGIFSKRSDELYSCLIDLQEVLDESNLTKEAFRRYRENNLIGTLHGYALRYLHVLETLLDEVPNLRLTLGEKLRDSLVSDLDEVEKKSIKTRLELTSAYIDTIKEEENE